MNEQVVNKANEFLLNMLEGLEKGTEFVSEKAPEVVQQLLHWHMVESIVSNLIAAFFLVIFCKCLTIAMGHLRCESCLKDKEEAEAFLSVLVGGISLAVSFLNMNVTFLKILTAPDLYLLEYAASLMK